MQLEVIFDPFEQIFYTSILSQKSSGDYNIPETAYNFA